MNYLKNKLFKKTAEVLKILKFSKYNQEVHIFLHSSSNIQTSHCTNSLVEAMSLLLQVTLSLECHFEELLQRLAELVYGRRTVLLLFGVEKFAREVQHLSVQFQCLLPIPGFVFVHGFHQHPTHLLQHFVYTHNKP